MRVGGGGVTAAMEMLDLPPSRYEVAHAIVRTAEKQQADLLIATVKALLSPWRQS